MKKIISLVVLTTLGFGINGCSTKSSLGHFTAASTHNVRNLDYDIENKTKVFTKGEACVRNIFGFTLGEEENRQEIAMNNAIRNGHQNGIDGDMLVNVQLTEEVSTFLYYSNCTIVEGDLIKLN